MLVDAAGRDEWAAAGRVGDVGENVAVAGRIRRPAHRVAPGRAFRPTDARSCIRVASAAVFLSIRGESRSTGPEDLDHRLVGLHVCDDRRVLATKS